MNKQEYSIPSDRFFPLPHTVTVDGKEYPIRWDTDTVFDFMEYVDESRDEDGDFVNRVLEIWYPQIPENRTQALDAALEFYRAQGPGPCVPCMKAGSAKERRKAVYYEFLAQFGIDLNRTVLHWWAFRELLCRLKERSRA